MSKIGVGYVFSTNGGCDAKVLRYDGSERVLIEFQDEHKHQKLTSTTHIRSGSVKNPYQPNVQGVGYVGVGKHQASIGTKRTPEYELWSRMMQRCYDKSYEVRRPTYRDCTVCDEWHNFQVFAEWLVNQEFYIEGNELDKDLLVTGNKLYSPEFCRFVPRRLNTILTNCTKPKGDYPLGVTFNKRERKFFVQMWMDRKSVSLGYFLNVDDAKNAYVTAKEAYVKKEAERLKDKMDNDVYSSLMSWTVPE